MNPLVLESHEYPFARLLDIKRQQEERGVLVLDFGMGDPRDPTPPFIRQALIDAVPAVSSYPTVKGSAALREAIRAYLADRFGLAPDPDQHLLPVNGSKEAIFTSSLALVDPRAEKNKVVAFAPAYPVYERGAAYAGARFESIDLEPVHGFLPDLDAIPVDVWRGAALVWINYPHNPTGAEATAEFFARMAELAREHDFVLGSDECYSDLYFADPPPSALVADDGPEYHNVLAFHSCSKRSHMTGYRSGFVAGDPRLITALAKFRPAVGVATPSFVQAAAVRSWSDRAHVREIVALYEPRRRLFLELFERKNWKHDGGAATFYLWLRVPDGFADSVEFSERLLDDGILVTPGAYLGERQSRHVRFALVAKEEDCKEAVRRLERL
jgi:succinyldiaminopimelate transaminase